MPCCLYRRKRKLPYWSINKPHRFPAPHGSVICREGTETYSLPIILHNLGSHQNIPFSSFQLIKGQLDISLLPASALTNWNGALGRSNLVPKTLCETKDFKIPCTLKEEFTRSKNNLWEIIKTHIYTCYISFPQHTSTYTYGKGEIAWKEFLLEISI